MELAGTAAGFEPSLRPSSLLTFSIDRILAPDFGPNARRGSGHKQPVGKQSFPIDKSFFYDHRCLLNIPTPPFISTEHPRAGLALTSPGKWRRRSVSPVRLDGPSPCCYSTDSCPTDGQCTPPTTPKIVSSYLYSYPAHPFDGVGQVDSKTFVNNWLQRQGLSPESPSRQQLYHPDIKHSNYHPTGHRPSASPDPKTTPECSEPSKNRHHWMNVPSSSPSSKLREQQKDSVESPTKKRATCSNVPSPRSPETTESPELVITTKKQPPSTPVKVQNSSSSAKNDSEATTTTTLSEPTSTNRLSTSDIPSPKSDDNKPDDWSVDSATTPPKRSTESEDRCSPSRCQSPSSCEGSEADKKKKKSPEPRPDQSKPVFGPSEYQKSVGDVEKKSSDKSAIFEKDMKLDDPWPVWVYCSRYSPRPSSGPRSRRQTKKEPSSDEKRCRTAFSGSQLTRLRQEFQGNPYLSEKRRLALAQDLKLTESQIKIWFQNRRAKVKRTCKEKDPLAMKLMEQGLYNHSTNKS